MSAVVDLVDLGRGAQAMFRMYNEEPPEERPPGLAEKFHSLILWGVDRATRQLPRSKEAIRLGKSPIQQNLKGFRKAYSLWTILLNALVNIWETTAQTNTEATVYLNEARTAKSTILPLLEEIVTLLEQAERSQNSQPDLSPFTFERVEWHGRALVIEPPLVLTPHLADGPEHLLCVELRELRVNAFAKDRASLEKVIVDQLFFLWDEFALESPAKLVSAAQRLRDALLARMQEEVHAT